MIAKPGLSNGRGWIFTFACAMNPGMQQCSISYTCTRASCELESSCLLCQGYFELYIVWSGVEVTSINDQRQYFVGFHSALKCEEEWPEEWESFHLCKRLARTYSLFFQSGEIDRIAEALEQRNLVDSGFSICYFIQRYTLYWFSICYFTQRYTLRFRACHFTQRFPMGGRTVWECTRGPAEALAN